MSPRSSSTSRCAGTDKFVLIWKQSGTVISTDRRAAQGRHHDGGATRVVRFPDLAAKIASEWKTVGTHSRPVRQQVRPGDPAHRQRDAVRQLIGVIDAIYQAHRPFKTGSKTEQRAAFNITFAVN